MLEFYEKDSDHFHFTLGAILAEEKWKLFSNTW
jgi:hypothetical protein